MPWFEDDFTVIRPKLKKHLLKTLAECPLAWSTQKQQEGGLKWQGAKRRPTGAAQTVGLKGPWGPWISPMSEQYKDNADSISELPSGM